MRTKQMDGISVETFWVKLPKATCKQIQKRQKKWNDAFNKGTGNYYFVLAIQPFAYLGEMKVSIVPNMVGEKIRKVIRQHSK